MSWPKFAEALKFMHLVTKEGLCDMEMVEVMSAYDHADQTELLATRAVADVLGVLISERHLGGR